MSEIRLDGNYAMCDWRLLQQSIGLLAWITYPCPCSHPCCDFEVFPMKGAVCIPPIPWCSSVYDLLCPLETDGHEALLVMTLDINRACVFPLPFSISVIFMRRSCPSFSAGGGREWVTSGAEPNHPGQTQPTLLEPSWSLDTWAKQMCIVLCCWAFGFFIMQCY